MKELIKIREENGQKLVSARELHEGLEIGQDFTSWIKRMIGFGFIENVDFTLTKFSEGRTIKHEYAITLDMAKHIAMVQRNEKGMQFRNYFIECEKQLQQKQTMLPGTYIEALEKLLETEKEKEKYKQTTELLLHDEKAYTTTEIAKELNLKSAIELNKKLCKDKIIFRQNNSWLLYSEYADKGYTSIKQSFDENGQIYNSTRWTNKGREFILRLYSQVEFIIK